MRVHVEDNAIYAEIMITVDGKDVTNRCWEADDEAGYAIYYRLNSEGKFFVVAGDVVRERLTGEVMIDSRLADWSEGKRALTPTDALAPKLSRG